jgi:PAS domain S-box-containing protein
MKDLRKRSSTNRQSGSESSDEARFRAIFENAAVGIARVSLDGRFLEVNERLCQIVGYSCDELMTRTFRMITHPEDVEADLNAQRQMLAGERSSYLREKRYYRKDGSVVWCNLSVALLRKADGSPDYFISVVEDNSASREAEQKHRESEERLRLASDAAELGVFEWDVQTDTAVWENQRMYEIFGHTPADGTLSKTKLIEDYVHPEDTASLDRALAEGMKSSRSFQTLYRIRRKDGATRWLSLAGKFEHRRTGGIRMIGVLADITEHHQAQEALRVREERFRTLADTAPVMIWMSGPDKLCTFFNKPWLNFTERSLEEELGNGWTDGVHPEDFDRCLGTYHKRFDARESFELEYRLRRYDGQYRWILDRGIPRFSSRDTFLGYIGTCIDITDQKATETALRESEERLAGIVSSAMDAIITVDDNRNIILFNEAAERMFGCTAAETLGQSIDRFIPGRFRPEHAEQLRRSGESPGRGGTERLSTLTALRADGTEFPIEASISTVEVRGRKLYTIIHRDITERKRAEAGREELAREQVARETAEAASRSKDEFVALVSHELRSPLTAILGYSRMLRSGLAGPGHADKAMAVIERSAKAQLQILEDLLDSARIITGKLQIEPSPTDLIPVLDAALETVRADADAKNIMLIDNFSRSPEQVLGDATRLQQIVWNLLTNAVKFTGEYGRVELAMAHEGDAVRIQVIDNGKGISQEFMPFVFDRFRQADLSGTRRHGGLGLGLALVKHLVELHLGTITAASEGPGLGSTFTVTLPRRQPESL